MGLEFTRCETCGIIFPSKDGADSLCPKCRQEDTGQASSRDQLRTLKGVLRDTQSRGVFLTIAGLSEASGIEEETIWHFIHTGQIDTASLNDPEVRSFLARKKKEMMKSAKPAGDTPPNLEQQAKKPKVSGFHLRQDDDSDR